MSELKCPVCGEKIEHIKDGWCNCKNRCTGSGSVSLWQELIRIRKELEQSETCCTEWEKQALDYKAENIALSGDLERTRKALDVAVDALKLFDSGQYTPQPDSYGLKTDASRLARKALEQITALEQKDK